MKDTSKIIQELKLCEDFRTFYSENHQFMVSTALAQMLDELIKEKGLKNPKFV